MRPALRCKTSVAHLLAVNWRACARLKREVLWSRQAATRAMLQTMNRLPAFQFTLMVESRGFPNWEAAASEAWRTCLDKPASCHLNSLRRVWTVDRGLLFPPTTRLH